MPTLAAIVLGVMMLASNGASLASEIVGRDVPTTRTFGIRRLSLDEGEAIGFGFHPTSAPIIVESSTAGLEVCSAELSEIYEGRQHVAGYWFDCLPLDPGRELELPAATVDHIGILVRSHSGGRARIGRLTITYVPGDEFFHFAPPLLEPGEQTAPLVVTPATQKVVTVDTRARGLEAIVIQEDVRIGLVDLADAIREGKAHGPVELLKPVIVRLENSDDRQHRVAAAVYRD